MAAAISLENHGDTDKATCALCRRQVARYTCPSCNVPYCSLICFRSEKHDQCSEGFYKRELEAEIHTKPSASLDERRQMIEMLRRLEEDGNDFDDADSEEDEDAEGLAAKLRGMDIESATFSQLWDALSPEQRKTFTEAVEKPDSESVQELLRGLEEDVTPPWWVRRDDFISLSSGPSEFKNRPKMFKLQASLIEQRAASTVQPLLYNICATLIAYSYVSRYLNFSPLAQFSGGRLAEDALSARHLLSELVPHITDRRSKVLFTNMDAVVFDLWPRLVNTGKVSQASFALFVRDASELLNPRKITPVPATPESEGGMDLEALPQSTALLALSDLIELFRTDREGKTRDTHSSAKLVFYAVQCAVLPAPILKAFAGEVAVRAGTLEAEGKEAAASRGPKELENKAGTRTRRESHSSPLIEEL